MKEKQGIYHIEKSIAMGIKSFESFNEAVQFLEEGKVCKVIFKAEIEGVGQFEGTMYKKSSDNITIELERI